MLITVNKHHKTQGCAKPPLKLQFIRRYVFDKNVHPKLKGNSLPTIKDVKKER
jgi:hypothetical protein